MDICISISLSFWNKLDLIKHIASRTLAVLKIFIRFSEQLTSTNKVKQY